MKEFLRWRYLPMHSIGAFFWIMVLVAACDTGPNCIKSHSETNTGYQYVCGQYGYNPSTGKWDYSCGYKYTTTTTEVCDAYASPTPENKQ